MQISPGEVPQNQNLQIKMKFIYKTKACNA